MRVAVIRADLPGPIFLADLEPRSQSNLSLGHGQTRYISRPDTTRIATYLTAQGLVASASALVTATVPVGGPVDVSSTTIKAVSGLSGATVTQVTALQDLLAPRLVETTVVRASWVSGNLKKLRNSTFNPDPNRLSASAAIIVVQDDGVTAYT